MNRCLRFLIPAVFLGLAFCAIPVSAQDALPLSSYCSFDGSAVTEDVYVFSSSDAVRDAVDRMLTMLGFPLTMTLRAANVEAFSAARVNGERYVLYNTYFAEGLAEDDWMAWGQLAHAVAHHVHEHTLEWNRDRSLEEIEADQLMGSILFRLGIPLDRLQRIAESVAELPAGPYPGPSLRRAAMTEGWTSTEARSDNRLAFAGNEPDNPIIEAPRPSEADIEPGPPPREGYPMFWPPPQASVQTIVPLPTLAATAPTSLGQVAKQLEEALDAGGYFERTYYAVPDGFAIVARIEQMHEDGTPKAPPDRWSLDVEPMRSFSLTAYFRALFTATPGHFRIVAFVVTSRPFTQQEAKVSRDQAQAWLDGGLNVLPTEIASRSVIPGHACTALVYTFEQPTRDTPLRFIDPSPVSARLHLERAGLWDRLR